MTREERLELLKQIEKDIHVCSLVSTLLDDAKSCAIHSVIEELKQKSCEDCISRQAVLDTTICDGISCNECSFNTCEDGQSGCLLEERISKLPPVTPQPKSGHWMPTYGNVKCSVCGSVKDSREVGRATHYCDFCGAKMENYI